NQNETPDPTQAQIATRIATYFKSRAAAMKLVDPAIKIFGVDSEDFQSGLHARLFGGSDNIAGKIPGKTYYYCDGLSWHRYPQDNGIDPALQGLADIRSRIEGCRALIDAVNLSQNRSGSEALLWGIGEFNSKNGAAVHTWGNGQMFAGVYGLSMKHGAHHASAWSLQESDGNRGGTDFSLFDGVNLTPRPSYWHTQFASRYFSGNYLEGSPSISSNSSDVLVFGAVDETLDQVSVMILNRGSTNARPYTLHLNSGATFAAAGATALNVNASRPDIHQDTIPARGTHVIVFRRDSITRVTYSNADFVAGNPPQTTVTPRSPLTRLIDDFNGYTNLSQQGYWSALPVGNGLVSLSAGKLVLRAADTAHASATVASPVERSYNFFDHSFAIHLDGFEQLATSLAPADSHFRLCLNSTTSRSFGADDSLVLRITPQNIRLGYKINQPAINGELRAGSAATESSLLDLAYTGTIRGIKLSLEPTATLAGITTILYRLQLDGSAGRIFRSGTFAAAAADWGGSGDSSLVLESRRDANTAGGSGSYVQAGIDNLSYQSLDLDHFTGAANLTDQTFWKTLLSPTTTTTSTALLSGGAAVLTARADAFGSAALTGAVLPDFNFFQRGFTLDLRDLALTSANLAPDQALFRISLNSTAARSFTTPDALTLRISPEGVRLGFKLDQPSTDAEFRAGTSTATAALFDIVPPATVTGLRFTLQPMAPAGGATPVFYTVRLTTAAGFLTRTGTFTADFSRWGTTGDSSLVLEARRANATAGAATSFMQASIGSIHHTSIVDDFLDESPHYAAWSLRQFSTTDLTDSSISGPAASPAGDGVSNLLKYAFGLDAKLPAAPGFLPWVAPVTGDAPVFRHEERAGASDIFYQVEASTDLVSWNIPVTEQTRGAAAAGWIAVGTRANLPAGSPKAFYRARVSRPLTP
ncbi:hypothetical protein HQ447_11840, partial [bacterium]|nr:hypothetical protein [bacterium]